MKLPAQARAGAIAPAPMQHRDDCPAALVTVDQVRAAAASGHIRDGFVVVELGERRAA